MTTTVGRKREFGALPMPALWSGVQLYELYEAIWSPSMQRKQRQGIMSHATISECKAFAVLNNGTLHIVNELGSAAVDLTPERKKKKKPDS